MPDAVDVISYGWPNNFVERLTQILMTRLGVTEAVTCSSGTAYRPTELWSATNQGLARLVTTADYDRVDITLTPWSEIRGVEMVANISEALPDPTGTLKVASVGLELDVTPQSSMGGSRAQQWPFVQAVLARMRQL